MPVAAAGPVLRDDGAVRLGEVAFAAIQGADRSTPWSPQSNSWLVVGRSVWPGWLIFVLGILTLVPGLAALRSEGTGLALRIAYSAVFTAVLYGEPEVALFALILPNLLPPSVPKKFLAFALVPLVLLVLAGAMGFVRGRVQGSWLSVWEWVGLATCFAVLYVAPGGRRRAPARAKREKR